MKRGAKRPHQSPRRAQMGTVTSGAGGTTEMIEFTEYRANPLAPTVLVNRVGGIYRVSHNLIKVTFALVATASGGARECVERVSLVWEPHDVLKANENCSWAFKEWVNGTFADALPDDGGGRRHRTQ